MMMYCSNARWVMAQYKARCHLAQWGTFYYVTRAKHTHTGWFHLHTGSQREPGALESDSCQRLEGGKKMEMAIGVYCVSITADTSILVTCYVTQDLQLTVQDCILKFTEAAAFKFGVLTKHRQWVINRWRKLGKRGTPTALVDLLKYTHLSSNLRCSH